MSASSAEPTEQTRKAHAVTYRTVLKHPQVQLLSASRAALKLAGATLSYGVMVFLAREGASQLEISFVSLTTYIAALLFGAQGGMLADSIAKRSLIVGGCFTLAGLCFFLPFVFGTGVPMLIVLMFLASAIAQLVAPGLKAVVALVSTPEEMATTGALISLIGSTASAIGSSFLAPILIKIGGLNLVLYCCSAIFIVGAVRAFGLPGEKGTDPWKEAGRVIHSWPGILSPKVQARWIRDNPNVASIVLLTAITVSLFEGFNTLMPVYVRDILGADPANSIYIFALAGVGFLIGTIFGPMAIAYLGEQRVIMIAMVIISIGMIGFGMVDRIAPLLAPFSPLRIVELFGIEPNDKILAASLIAIPANLGSSLATASAQVYINRNVPVAKQGRLFGMQDVQRNIINAIMVLSLGVIATFIPVDLTILISPALAFGLVVFLMRFNLRISADNNSDVTVRQAAHALLGRQSVT